MGEPYIVKSEEGSEVDFAVLSFGSDCEYRIFDRMNKEFVLVPKERHFRELELLLTKIADRMQKIFGSSNYILTGVYRLEKLIDQHSSKLTTGGDFIPLDEVKNCILYLIPIAFSNSLDS